MLKRLLFLTIFAVSIITLLFCMLYYNIYRNSADISEQSELPDYGEIHSQLLIFAIILLLIIIAIIIIMRRRFPKTDAYIFPLILLLNGVGLAQINRVDFSQNKIYDDYNFAIWSQLLFTIIGIALFITVQLFLKSDRALRGLTWTSMVFGIILIILPLVPGLGIDANGANVWIKLGPLGTMQPAEFAKTFLIIFFAGYLTINRERLQLAGKRILGLQLPRFEDFGPILVVWAVSLCVLVFQHDLGTSLLFFALFIALLYVATGKVSWAVIGLLFFSFGAFVCMQVFSHVAMRINAWLDPFNPDVYDRAFNGSGQIVQGYFALSSGELFGRGIGEGYPSLTPFSNSDFIYTSLGEEFGLTGLLAILLLYLILAQRAFSISLRINDRFGKLLSCGIGFSLCIQIFVVIGGVTGVIPVTGLTLPFIARGGSSLMANYLLFGILQLVSNRVNSEQLIKAQKVKHLRPNMPAKSVIGEIDG